MFLCNIRGFGHRTAHPHHREQLQQVLRQTEEVGEARDLGCSEEVSEPVNFAQSQCG